MADVAPPLSPAAQAYAWRELARRAGVVGGDPHGTGFESLGLHVHYAVPEEAPAGPDHLVVRPAGRLAWSRVLDREPGHGAGLPGRHFLPANSTLRLEEPVPLPLGDVVAPAPGAERRPDGTAVFHADILGTVLFMLGRWEEAVMPAADAHDRFPAAASTAYRHGFLHRPLVDEYGLILREWLKVLRPGWTPAPRRFAVKLSHDIDQVRPFHPWVASLRALGGDLARRRSVARAHDTAVDALAQALAPDRTSAARGILALADMAESVGLAGGAYYFMAADPRPPDNDYDVASPTMRRAIDALQRRGAEIGFHAGYHTLDNPALLAAQKARLDAVLGRGNYGGRQHFLRFRAPATWRHWETAGLAYDATLGYADHEGFRCGTCHPYRPFDLEQDRELRLWEVPLIAMDATLRRYRGLTPEQAVERVIELARRCRDVEGTFTLLWHNTSLAGPWRPWAAAYARMLAELAAMTS
jgi:hypothetical protein